MRKHYLLAGVATAVAFTGAAQAQITGSLDADVDYYNEITGIVEVETNYEKDVFLSGGAILVGAINVDSSAVAIADNKQLLGGLDVEFREETPVDGSEDPEPSDPANPGDGLVDDPGGTLGGGEPTDIGFYASVINDSSDVIIADNEGNIGVNMAAGYFNQQENIAVLASSDYSGGADGAAEGWAEAALIAAQGAGDLYYGPDPDTDDETSNDVRDRNFVGSVEITGGSGNIGVNNAAGAFNQQKNALVVAVATNASLAEANSGVLQASLSSTVTAMNSRNYTEDLTLTGNAGNVGVNVAAGVGNQQLNALAIAATPGGDGGGTPTPTPGIPNTGGGRFFRIFR
jgi:hypothetical protein